jgi:hypothetical protein
MVAVIVLSAVAWALVFVAIVRDDQKLGNQWVQQMRKAPRRARWDPRWASRGYRVDKATLGG